MGISLQLGLWGQQKEIPVGTGKMPWSEAARVAGLSRAMTETCSDSKCEVVQTDPQG